MTAANVKFPPVACVPGVNFPNPADLQTGDILFPRVPRTGGAKNGDELDDKSSRYLESLGLSDIETFKQHFEKNRKTWSTHHSQQLESAPKAGGLDIGDPANLMLLMRILEASFKDEINIWFGLTMTQFFRHPLMKILLGALNKDLGDGFFVGHCALVLRDPSSTDPADLYVIEANITDYSHYGVSIHPYYINPVQDGGTAGQMRGWANHRAALGQKAWAKRPNALNEETPPVDQLRQLIVCNAKKHIGRPYGFFDSPRFGDTDRLYCSEFISQVFQETSPGHLQVDDRRKWDWLVDNIGGKEFGKKVKAAIATEKPKIEVEGTEFFILTVHMLWCSANLNWLFSPTNDEHEYAP